MTGVERSIAEEIERTLDEKIHEFLKVSEGNEIPCDLIPEIATDVYLVFGEDYIARIREKEEELDHPPIYFKDGECPELREKLGIKEDGVYLLTKNKRVKKVKI